MSSPEWFGDTLGEQVRAVDDYVTTLLMNIDLDPDVQFNPADALGMVLVHQQVLARAVLAIARHLDGD